MIGGLTAGQTYSFAVWYRDRGGNLSPRSTATLIGTTLTMTSTSTATGAATAAVTFRGTARTPAGAAAGLSVPLVAVCAGQPSTGVPAATATANSSGSLSVTLTIGALPCSYRWQITNSTTHMGAASPSVRVTAGPNPPAGDEPPRER
jgi:hypothetical protein